MTSEGVSVRRLGDVSPRMSHQGTSGRDFVDPSPIVLWGGARPAAILYLEVETRGRKAVQRIAPAEKGVKLPGFPFTYTVQVPQDAASEDDVEAVETGAVVTADLDGDGVQELVLLRKLGGVSVHAVRGPLAEYPSPGRTASGAAYRHRLTQVARLGARDVVWVLATCDAPDAADRNLLLRVDGAGVARVHLEGLERVRVLAVGAVQRPASQGVDELLVLTADGDGDAALARFRPDGKPIASPRRMYVRPPEGSAFVFAPRSAAAVLEGPGSVLVVSPEKPANWLREIKLARKVDPRDVEVHWVADLEGEPKLVYGVGDELWAVDHDGTCHAPAPGGKWTALPKPGPYLEVPVPAGELLWFVWKSEAGPLFALSSGSKGTRPVAHEEWRRVADRFLPPEDAARFRKMVEPSLTREHEYRDLQMKDERQRRHVEPEQVRTVEDWKRLLPDSYAEVIEFDARTHDVKVESRLRALSEDAKAALPDRVGLGAWLDGLERPARTTFLVIEGTAVSAVHFPGAPPRQLPTQVARPVEYRLRDGRVVAVLTLEAGDSAGRAGPAFHLVEAPLGARR